MVGALGPVWVADGWVGSFLHHLVMLMLKFLVLDRLACGPCIPCFVAVRDVGYDRMGKFLEGGYNTGSMQAAGMRSLHYQWRRTVVQSIL